MKKIVGFAGSISDASINKQLVRFAMNQLSGVEVKLLDLNDFEMPIFSVDREKNGFPDAAMAFRKEMENADAIVCSLAEHNRSYSAAFKNILDWCSRVDMNIFAGKPMLLMSASPGGFGGGNVMAAASTFFPKCGANVIETFSLGKFYDNFKDGNIVDAALSETLNAKLEKFSQTY